MPTPTEPVITGYSTDTGTIGDNITADRSITFTGTGTPGASLEIIAFGAYSGTVAFLSAIPASGNWTVTVGDGGSFPVGSDGELQNGSYSFRAGSRIGADASSLSPALDITVDGPELSGIDLTSASDTGPSNTDNYTADSTPAIEFTAGNGDALEIDWGDGLGYQSVGTGTGGSQTFTNPNAYPNGITEEKTILVRSTKDGTSTVESLTFTYDRETTSPNGNIDASSDTGSSQTDHITSDTTPTLSGTGEVGATIEIKLGDGLSPTVATAIVGSGGTWSTTLSALSEGSYPLTLRSVDKAGNVNQLSGGGFTIDTTDPAAPAISATISQDTGISSTDRVTQDDTVRVSGTTEANTVVRIYDGAVLVGIDQTTSTGNWAITTSSLSDGVHTLRAEAEDLAGNKSILSSGLEVTVDTTAPTAPTLDLAAASDTGASSSDDVTSDTTPTLNGTAEAGTTVEVFDGSTSLGTTTANGSGVWSFTAAALSEGSHNLTAVATDLAGNTSPAATALAITIDTTAPGAPTLDLTAASDTGASSSDNVTNDTTPTLNGTAEAGTTVEVFDGSTSLGTTTANGSGAWSFTAAALSEGSHNLTAVATDLAGNTSPAATALSITIDTTAPGAPTLDLTAASDTGASSSDNVTNDTTPTLNGTAEAGTTVEVFDGSTSLGTTTANGSGAWSFTAAALSEGSHSLTAIATDLAGNTSPAATALSITIDTTAPTAPTLDLAAASDTGASDSDNVTSDTTPTLNGTAEAGTTVEIFDGSTSLGATTANGSGAWSFTAAALSEGSHNLTAVATDLAGNTSPAATALSITIDTTAPGAPTLDLTAASDTGASSSDNVTNDTTPTLNGTAEAGTTVEVFDGSTSLGTTTANGSGAWSFTAAALSEGSHSLTAIATDLAGNTSPAATALSITIDTTAPAAPTLDLAAASDTGASDSDNVTSDTTPTLNGTAEAGTTVEIFDGSTSLGATTANGSGAWSFTAAALSEGSHNLTAVATDLAGNTSPAATALSITIDTTAPGAPTLDLTAASDTGASSSDNVTNDTTPTLNGTAEAGTTVEVFDGSTSLGTTTANGSGAWSFTAAALSEGSHSLTAIATDLAGNTSPAATALSITIDTTAPAAPTLDLAAASDTGASDSDNVTSDTTPTLNGTAEAGTTVEIFDGSTSLGATTANGSGAWSFTAAALSEGSHNLTAVATDLAGNTSPAATALSITIDTTAPGVPVISGFSDDTGVAGDGVTSDTTPTLSGTAEANITVQILRDGVLVGSVTADGSGDWSFTNPALTEDTFSFVARAVDTAGNTSSSDALSIHISSAVVATPVITAITDDTGATDGVTSDSSLAISGTSVAGATIELFLGAVSLGTTTANGTGSWSFDYSGTDLADGDYTFTARASLSGADPSGLSTGFDVTIDTTAPAAPTLDLAAASDTGASDSDNVTSDTTPTLNGTAEAGTTVEIFDGSTSLGATTANGSGAWSFTAAALSEGSHNLTAVATDLAGNTSPAATALSITIDTTAPGAPTLDLTAASDTGASSSDNVTNDTTPTLNGTAEAGTTVEVFDGSTSLGTTTANGSGAWSFTAAALSEGSHSLTAIATDLAGNTSPAATALSITIDTTAPTAPTLDLAAASDTGASDSDNVTSDTTPTLNGTAEAGTTVEIFDGSTSLGATTANGSGAWSFTAAALSEGSHNLTAVATDLAGNTSPAATALSITIDTTAPGVPVISGFSDDTGVAGDGVTSDTTPTLSGTAEANITVQILRDGVLVGSVTADGSGDWSFTNPALTEDTFSFVARAVDTAGNTSSSDALSIHISSAVVATPVITAITDDTGATDGVTSDSSLAISGTSVAGATIELFLGAVSLGTTTANGTGSWSFDYSGTDLADGDYTFTARASLSGADPSGLSTGFDVTIDTTAPAAPTLDLAAASDTGASDSDNVTSDTTPTLNGTAEAGTTVEIFDGSTSLGATTANGSGAWSFTAAALSEGSHNLTAVATDLAGNTSPAATALSITIDTTAPGVPVISGFSDDTGVAGDGVTSDTTPTLSGTAEANITVQILRDGVLVGSVTADGSGDWSFTNPALTEDTFSFVARAVDTAGNTSSSDALSIHISSAVVATPVITAITDDTGATDGVTSDSSLAISGTSVAGATIELFLGAVSLGTTTANGTGSWSFDYSGTDLADGDYTFTARASLSGADPSGLSTGFDVTIDTTAPAAPTLDLAAASDTGASSSDDVTSDRMLELVGTAETGSLVEVFDGSISLGSVKAVDGSWAFTTPNLSDGVHSLTVVATDTAGNVSPTATPVEVTVDRIAPAVPTLSLAAVSDSGVAGDGKTTISAPTLVGSAEAGALVEILRDGVVVGNATADAAGDWSYTSPELDVDTYAFKARSTDAAGNTSEQSTATPVEILPLEGAVPVITRVGKDSGISNSDGITADSTPAIRGTGVAGETVTVFLNGDEIGTAVVKGSGKWVLPFAGEPLEDGAYSITATAKADDGIVSDPSAVFALIIDTEAPKISAPNLIRASDSGNLRNDDLTNDTSPTVKFTAEDGASIEVDWGDGSGFIAAGTGNGSAQKVTLATPYGSDGVKTVQLRATDAAGNVTATTLDLTVDTEAPSTGAVTGFEGDTGIVGDHVTTDRRLVFNGTADPASTVSVLLNGVAVGVALSDATGAWTFDYTDVRLKAGEYVLTLSTSDGAGNLAPLSDGFDFTVLNRGIFEITTDAIDTAVSYEVGTVIARLEVLNFAGDVDYTLAKTFRGTVGLDGDEIVITGDFDPTKIRSLDIGVTATIAGGEQVTGTIDLSDFIAVGLVGPDGIMRGGPGDDTMTGTGGDDIVFAGFGDDRIEGGNGNDAINGGAGNDTITDKDGDNVLVGANGDDVLLAMNGRNVLSGGKGNDVLLGGLGKDRLKGGAGNDILKSDSSAQIGGRDHLNGGRGDDLLEGGIGSDTFVFRTDQGNDTIGRINIDFTDTQASTVDNADFQSGLDKVALIGFGYTDSGEAFAHLSDVNGEATFADQGLTIRFAGLTVADLAETDFFIY